MVGMNHRYRPDVQIVRSFVQSGELGTIESIRGSWHVFRPGRTQLGWRQRRDQAGGGAMLDLGLSVLDLGLWLGGSSPPVRVSASLDASGKDRAVEQSGSAFVICENGMSIFVDVTWRHLGEGERFGVGLRGSKGTAGINPLNVWKELHGMAVDVSPTGSVGRENAFTASYRAEWAHFQAAIAGEAQGARRSRSTSSCTRWSTPFTARRSMGETWSCEGGRADGRTRRTDGQRLVQIHSLLPLALLVLACAGDSARRQNRPPRRPAAPSARADRLPHDDGPR